MALGYPAGAMSLSYIVICYILPLFPLLLLLTLPAADASPRETDMASRSKPAGPKPAAPVTEAPAAPRVHHAPRRPVHHAQGPAPVIEAPEPQAAPVTHAPKRARTGAERQAAYRARGGTEYNARHAAYMREWRARRRVGG